MSDDKGNFSRNLIYGYSRAQAPEGGVLLHVPNAVYKYHTAVTAEVLELVGEERMREFLVASATQRVKSWETGGPHEPDLPGLDSLCRQQSMGRSEGDPLLALQRPQGGLVLLGQ